jgi:hypothetical protein
MSFAQDFCNREVDLPTFTSAWLQMAMGLMSHVGSTRGSIVSRCLYPTLSCRAHTACIHVNNEPLQSENADDGNEKAYERSASIKSLETV